MGRSDLRQTPEPTPGSVGRAKVSTGALVGRLWKANFHHYLVFSGRPDNPNRGCLSPGGAVRWTGNGRGTLRT